MCSLLSLDLSFGVFLAAGWLQASQLFLFHVYWAPGASGDGRIP